MLPLPRDTGRLSPRAERRLSTPSLRHPALRVLALATIVLAFGCAKERCTPGTTLACICPGSKGAQTCKPDGSGYEKCVCASVPEISAPKVSAPKAVTNQPTKKAERKPTPAVKPAAVAAPADTASKGSEVAMAAAQKAYREVIQAFNAHHADRYFSGFADPFCFYAGNKDGTAFRKTRGKLFAAKKMQLTATLKVLRASPKEVLLWDTGTWATAGNTPKPHNKLILMRLVGGAWLIAVEASIKRHQCAPTLLEGVPDALLAKVGAATQGGAQVRARLAQMDAKKTLCVRQADRLGRDSSEGNAVICIVETSSRTEGKGGLQKMVTGYVTVQKGIDIKRIMRFDSRTVEGAAGRSHLSYTDAKLGHSLKVAFCRPCDPPGYEDLAIKAGSFKFEAGTVEVTKGAKDGGF